MKVYLVGGAVRDELLNIPVLEKDWVVVGSTPEELLRNNFRQVGKSFPVFLHPVSKEEYALARTEKKSAPGYHGFICDFNSSISLEEDLARRDLTINAIAKNDEGQLIDPFGGKKDIDNRILRHVSPAFAEDPVRVLRVARFAARYYYLGFRLANETRMLMYSMVRKGELGTLVVERVWQEWHKSICERNPEQFIEVLRSCGALKIIIPELDILFGIPNSCGSPLEIDNGVRALQVLKAASSLSSNPLIRFAALIHDIGKACSLISSWPNHYHDVRQNIFSIDSLCNRLKVPTEYRRIACMVSRFYSKIYRIKELDAETIINILEQADAFRRSYNFNYVLNICEADAQVALIASFYKVKVFWNTILTQTKKITAQCFIKKGYNGIALKNAIRESRIECAQQILDLWKNNEK